jgi:hypothetical protein
MYQGLYVRLLQFNQVPAQKITSNPRVLRVPSVVRMLAWLNNPAVRRESFTEERKIPPFNPFSSRPIPSAFTCEISCQN